MKEDLNHSAVLFFGSLRFNLVPLGERTCGDSPEQVKFKSVVVALPDRIDGKLYWMADRVSVSDNNSCCVGLGSFCEIIKSQLSTKLLKFFENLRVTSDSKREHQAGKCHKLTNV